MADGKAALFGNCWKAKARPGTSALSMRLICELNLKDTGFHSQAFVLVHVVLLRVKKNRPLPCKKGPLPTNANIGQ